MEMIPQNAGHKYIAHRTHGCVRVWQEHLAEVKEIAARGSSQQFRSKGLKGKVFHISPKEPLLFEILTCFFRVIFIEFDIFKMPGV